MGIPLLRGRDFTEHDNSTNAPRVCVFNEKLAKSVFPDEDPIGVVAETSSGSIEITTAKGKVEAKNSGGDVRIDEADGVTVARTSSGSIVVKLAKGKVDARNSGGKFEVNEARDVVLAHTSSGPIIVGLGAQPKADSQLEVSGGDIKVTLPRSAA